jgi:hypothetical protein
VAGQSPRRENPEETLVESASAISDMLWRGSARAGASPRHNNRGENPQLSTKINAFPGGSAPPPPYLSSSGSTGPYTKTNGACPASHGGRNVCEQEIGVSRGRLCEVGIFTQK